MKGKKGREEGKEWERKKERKVKGKNVMVLLRKEKNLCKRK